MRRFIILSLFTLATSAPIWACGGEGVNHNYYLFSVFRHELMSMSLFEDRINAFWNSYTNGKTDAYRWNEELIMNVAKKKGDHGHVVLQFIVEKDGSLSNIKVVRSVSKELDNEALRVVKKITRFVPGYNKSHAPVRVLFTLPVNFKL